MLHNCCNARFEFNFMVRNKGDNSARLSTGPRKNESWNLCSSKCKSKILTEVELKLTSLLQSSSLFAPVALYSLIPTGNAPT